MYSVVSIVTPIEFGAKAPFAIQAYNTATKREFNDLDTRILIALSNAARGTPAMKLREEVSISGKNIFSAVFNRAVNKMIKSGFLTRTKHRKWIYYNITMKGRTALEQINQHLIDIVNKEMERRNKQ
jgi:predicted transcriptional regulator